MKIMKQEILPWVAVAALKALQSVIMSSIFDALKMHSFNVIPPKSVFGVIIIV